MYVTGTTLHGADRCHMHTDLTFTDKCKLRHYSLSICGVQQYKVNVTMKP